MGNIFFPPTRATLHCNSLQLYCKLKSVVGITSRDASCGNMLEDDRSSNFDTGYNTPNTSFNLVERKRCFLILRDLNPPCNNYQLLNFFFF